MDQDRPPEVALERAPRLIDVAKAAGVSQGTASNVFNRPDIVREEVRERVLAAAKALGYAGPDPKGRLLRAGKVNAIGVVTAQPISHFFTDPYARVLMSGIAEACDAYGAGLSAVSAAQQESLNWNVQSALVDGFILFCIEHGELLVRLTRERQLPFVALALGVDDESIPAIGVDDVEGGRMAAEHLLSLGHRDFAILALPFQDDGHIGRVGLLEVENAYHLASRDRIRGSFAALREAGIDTDNVPIFETENEENSVEKALDDIYASGRPTALLAQSDRIALAALDGLRRKGLNVPGDVSIIGFDGVVEGTTSSPPLTTIAQPMAEIGRRAVKAILGPDRPAGRQKLPLELVIRGSTAPPRGG